MKRITLLAAAFALAALMVPGAGHATHAGGTSCTTAAPCTFELGADAGPVFVSLLGTGAFLTDAAQAGVVDNVTMTWTDANGNTAATIVCTTTYGAGAPTAAGACSVNQAASYAPGTQTLSILSASGPAAGSIALSSSDELY